MTAQCAIATLEDVQAHLGSCSRVVVSGPQRSGTTFAAQALADTLRLRFVDEHELKVGDPRELTRLLAHDDSWCLQAPGFSYMLHHLPAVPGLAVVWMLRDHGEILASQRRVGWCRQQERLERDKYEGAPQCSITMNSRFKLWHWRTWQAAACAASTYELQYDSDYLTSHRLHIGKAQRQSFGAKQTTLSGHQPIG